MGMNVAAMLWMFVCPRIICWNPNPDVILLGGGAFGRCLGDEDEGFMDGIHVLIKQTTWNSLATLAQWTHGEKALTVNQKENPHQNANMLIPYPGILTLENCENHISVVCELPSLCYFVIAAQMAKTTAMINGYDELTWKEEQRQRSCFRGMSIVKNIAYLPGTFSNMTYRNTFQDLLGDLCKHALSTQ